MRENKFPVQDLIVPQDILISVYDKKDLDILIEGIFKVNQQAIFYSTAGTGKKVKEILGETRSRNYHSLEEFTGCPEMEGGLVKTLHPKIYAGLLGERGNPEHQKFLFETMRDMTGTKGVYFDVMVCNFYPFGEVVKERTDGTSVTPEEARINIDVGGPTMVRATAKNWHRVAVIMSPKIYTENVKALKKAKGFSAAERFYLAVNAFERVAEYDLEIARYFLRQSFTDDVRPRLKIQ